MLISLKWLNDWIDLSHIPTRTLVDSLSVSGLEVASVQEVGQGHDSIVVGKIVSIEPHPKADRLVVCTIDVAQTSHRTIVCGATNMSEGDLVPVALPSSRPPGIDFEIVERKVMGVVSSGMLCAKEELGLAESSDGLWILPNSLDSQLGTPIFDAMGIRDTILEIEVTPNRPDALSHLGVARDLAALFQLPLRSYQERLEQLGHLIDPTETSKATVGTCSTLELALDVSVPVVYALTEINQLSVQPSSEALQLLLAKVGLRPVNQIVDITNFIMFDIGQPLHAFDASVTKDHIVVRQGKEKESFTALNHKEYDLSPHDLVISNSEGLPLALAGVMGGAQSEVTDSTQHILLECAYFHPTSIRKTSKRHHLSSDASFRYERGMDSQSIQQNLEYTLRCFGKFLCMEMPEELPMLFAEYAPGKPTKITFSASEYERLIGESIKIEKIREIFTTLGFETDPVDGILDTICVTVPGYRPDIERPVDLVEELVRIVGVNQIAASHKFTVSSSPYQVRDLDNHTILPTLVPQKTTRWLQRLRDTLLASGFYENVTYSFMSQSDPDDLLISEDDKRSRRAVQLSNPLTLDHYYMRTMMLPAMLSTAKLNVSRKNHDGAFFEIGRTYFKGEGGEPHTELLKLSLFTMGRKTRHFTEKNAFWDFFDLKGIIEDLFSAFNVTITFEVPDVLENYLHPNVQADIFVEHRNEARSMGQKKVGHLGRLHPKILGDLEDPIFFAEIDLEPLAPRSDAVPAATPLSKYQPVTRDFAFIAPENISWKQIKQTILSAAQNDDQLCHDLRFCNLFDVYKGDHIDDGFRSIAFSVVYQSSEKTLTEQEIARYDQIIVTPLTDTLKLVLRG